MVTFDTIIPRYAPNDDSYAVCDGTGEDPKCSASVPGIAQSILAHTVYMGIDGVGECPTQSSGRTFFISLLVLLGGVSAICCACCCFHGGQLFRGMAQENDQDGSALAGIRKESYVLMVCPPDIQ